MEGNQRREKIVQRIFESESPISGKRLAQEFQVSRQVIVQDIALLRANQVQIVSTHRGYVLPRVSSENVSVRRNVQVYHTDEQTRDELETIVDFGGNVIDVSVEHDVYGPFRAELSISSRRDVNHFIRNLETGASTPLKNITLGYHFHLIEAPSEEIMDEIEEELEIKGYLVGN